MKAPVLTVLFTLLALNALSVLAARKSLLQAATHASSHSSSSIAFHLGHTAANLVDADSATPHTTSLDNTLTSSYVWSTQEGVSYPKNVYTIQGYKTAVLETLVDFDVALVWILQLGFDLSYYSRGQPVPLVAGVASSDKEKNFVFTHGSQDQIGFDFKTGSVIGEKPNTSNLQIEECIAYAGNFAGDNAYSNLAVVLRKSNNVGMYWVQLFCQSGLKYGTVNWDQFYYVGYYETTKKTHRFELVGNAFSSQQDFTYRTYSLQSYDVICNKYYGPSKGSHGSTFGQCKLCQNLCEDCAYNETCTKEVDHAKLVPDGFTNSDGKKVTSATCNDGYYFKRNSYVGQCDACPAFCSKCDSSSVIVCNLKEFAAVRKDSAIEELGKQEILISDHITEDSQDSAAADLAKSLKQEIENSPLIVDDLNTNNTWLYDKIFQYLLQTTHGEVKDKFGELLTNLSSDAEQYLNYVRKCRIAELETAIKREEERSLKIIQHIKDANASISTELGNTKVLIENVAKKQNDAFMKHSDNYLKSTADFVANSDALKQEAARIVEQFQKEQKNKVQEEVKDILAKSTTEVGSYLDNTESSFEGHVHDLDKEIDTLVQGLIKKVGDIDSQDLIQQEADVATE